MRLSQILTKTKEDQMLFSEGVISENGRLTDDGRKLFVDLLFQGNTLKEAKQLIVSEIIQLNEKK